MADVVDAFMRAWNVPGVSVAIARQGQLVYAQGFGQADESSGAKVTTASLFRIASISKPIASVAVRKLVEGGRLTLADTVFGCGVAGSDWGSVCKVGVSGMRVVAEDVVSGSAGQVSATAVQQALDDWFIVVLWALTPPFGGMPKVSCQVLSDLPVPVLNGHFCSCWCHPAMFGRMAQLTAMGSSIAHRSGVA
ncbi:MAG: serine hydrolase domain-containing protein [Pseudonocardiaceae bacterium]